MTTPETVFHEGIPGRPLVLFIHGMGMDSRIWVDPARARVLGGKYPLSALLAEDERELRTSFIDFRERGFPVLTWSQGRPAGPIAFAVRELKEIVTTYHDDNERPVIIIAHSRGGLVARKYLEYRQDMKGAFITIATPHRGSSMARLGAALSPVASVISTMLGDRGVTSPSTPFRRVLAFLKGSGLKELLPDSPFFTGLKDTRLDALRYISIGGTDPNILKVRGVPVAEMISRALPDRLLPEELQPGRGDGLVTSRSAKMPYADEHIDFPLNHLTLLFDARLRETILSAALPIG